MTRQKVFMIVQSVICALVAGLLAWSALSLYFTGMAEKAGGDLFFYIYTREKVGAKLLPLMPLIFLGLGMTLAGLILGVRDESADKPVRDPETLRDLTCARVRNPSAAMTAEHARQQKLLYGGWIGFAVCMVPVGVYILNPAHFDRPLDTESDLYALMKVFAPFTLLAIGCLAVTTVLRQKSIAREAEAAKLQSAAEKAAGVKAAAASIPVRGVAQNGGRGVLALRIVLAALVVIMIIVGIQNGGMEDVLTKANAICMECVGLG